MTETGEAAVVTVMLAAREQRWVEEEEEPSWESGTVLSWLEEVEVEAVVPVLLELEILKVEEVPKQEAVEAALLGQEQMMLEEAEGEGEQRSWELRLMEEAAAVVLAQIQLEELPLSPAFEMSAEEAVFYQSVVVEALILPTELSCVSYSLLQEVELEDPDQE